MLSSVVVLEQQKKHVTHLSVVVLGQQQARHLVNCTVVLGQQCCSVTASDETLLSQHRKK